MAHVHTASNSVFADWSWNEKSKVRLVLCSAGVGWCAEPEDRPVWLCGETVLSP